MRTLLVLMRARLQHATLLTTLLFFSVSAQCQEPESVATPARSTSVITRVDAPHTSDAVEYRVLPYSEHLTHQFGLVRKPGH